MGLNNDNSHDNVGGLVACIVTYCRHTPLYGFIGWSEEQKGVIDVKRYRVT